MNKPIGASTHQATFIILAVIAAPLVAVGVVEKCLAADPNPFVLQQNQPVMFLGDSITNNGTYIAYINAYLKTRWPDHMYDLINLGLSSETASGLSEDDHPGPRPWIHERLQRAFAATKPKVVVACYGMNDGIYHPFAEDRFQAYREGINRLIAEARAAGCQIVLLTPPPFDGASYRKQLFPADAEEFGYKYPFKDYDKVLGRYATWVLGQGSEVDAVVNLHAPINEFYLEYRKVDPQFKSGDGVHPKPFGHWLIAREILRAWNLLDQNDVAKFDAATGKVSTGNIGQVEQQDGETRFEWTTRIPMPTDPKWEVLPSAIQNDFGKYHRFALIVTGLRDEQYDMYTGDTLLGRVTRDQLQGGVDLRQFSGFGPNKAAAELLDVTLERHRMLSAAWREHVGHKRQNTPSAIPLDEAKAKAAELDRRIDELAQPQKLKLRLVAVSN